jgi:methylase of polypeptide subunit release factors
LDRVVDEALLALLQALERSGYSFTTVTPATHERVVARRAGGEARDLRDVFGWSLPFREALLTPDLLEPLRAAEAVEETGEGLFKSLVRVASLDGHLFLHSAFPTTDEQSVFFGPDTYRFAHFIEAELPRLHAVRRIVDVGAGSGAGGITALCNLEDAHLTLSDINPEALKLASVNAAHAGVSAEVVEGAGLEAVTGPVDLILANPPYMMDEGGRDYRNGGDMHGAGLALEWVLAAARRLDPRGHMLLYTGVAIIDGRDALRDALERALPSLSCTIRYRELDPDVFGEELDKEPYASVDRIAAVGAVIERL